MADPFPPSDFDEWAETYDDSVLTDRFPFQGYRDVLTRIFALAETRPGLPVLDLGTGTGNLAGLFARAGCELWCTDFSEAMLAKGREKLPTAHFFLHDLRTNLPPGLPDSFDLIVSAYVFHHFEMDEKIRIIKSAAARLAPAGRIVIGDIAFIDRAVLERVKAEAGDEWEDEFYWLVDESLFALEDAGLQAAYQQVSSCAGVFVIQPA
jgi:putative AdoMet-dependent methyltransferase